MRVQPQWPFYEVLLPGPTVYGGSKASRFFKQPDSISILEPQVSGFGAQETNTKTQRHAHLNACTTMEPQNHLLVAIVLRGALLLKHVSHKADVVDCKSANQEANYTLGSPDVRYLNLPVQATSATSSGSKWLQVARAASSGSKWLQVARAASSGSKWLHVAPSGACRFKWL